MPNLLDLMTDEDKAWVKQRTIERTTPKYKQDIPMPLFLCAQLGYYYGWDAVVDFRRGYHTGYDAKGQITRYAFSLEDAVSLVEAARKVHYTIKLDEGRIHAATNVSSHDKKYAKSNADYVNNIAKRLSGQAKNS